MEQSTQGDIRAERLRVAGLFAFFFLVIAAFWVQKPIRTSRFLAGVGPAYLPLVKLGTALCIAPVVMLYTWLAARFRREHMVYLCSGTFAACSLLFWSLFSKGAPAWTHYAYFFYVDVFNSVMVALFWSVANDICSPQQARRDYGVIGAGGILGGAAGAALTGWAVEPLGTANLLLVCVALLAAIAGVAFLLSRAASEAGQAPQRDPSWRDAIAGARLTLASRYLLCIAAMVVLYEITSNVIDYQFNTYVAARYPDQEHMAAFLGRFSSASIVASLAAQFVLTTWILRRWGPSVGLLILPLALALGSTAFLLVPVFTTIAAAFFGDATLSYSLNQATKEVLYTPTDQDTKYQAKAFIDMFLMRLGKGVSAVLILGWMAWLAPLGLGVSQLACVSLAATLAWIAVARVAARHFAEQTQPGGRTSEAAPPARLPSLRRAAVRTSLLFAAVLCCHASPAVADDDDTLAVPSHIQELDESEVDRRLADAELRLDHGSDYAHYWWLGWASFYTLGVVVQGTRAGLSHDDDERADYVVSAVKATGGAINLWLSPLEAQKGAEPVRAMPSRTAEDRRRQLARAEEQLAANARESDKRYSWVRHALNFGFNAAGGLILWQGFDDPDRAWQSTLIGTAVGELTILSRPWWPRREWEEYQRRFGIASPTQVSWHLSPRPGGVALEIEF